MVGASARVFQVSELVYLISEFIDKKTLARLAVTSKTFFLSMIPHIWESVSGAAPLFQLLPCTISNERFEIDHKAYFGYFSLSVDGRLGPVSSVVASALCHLLISTCPNLVALEFEPLFTRFDSEQDKYIRCQVKEVDYISTLLQPCSVLRRLSVSLDFIIKYASLVSQMQNLTYLEIQECGGWNFAVSTKLPPNSFPTLTTLKFSWVRLVVFESIWGSIPDIFSSLVTLECAFIPSPHEDEGDEGVSGFPLRFATFLNRVGPYVTNLTLQFDPNGYFGNNHAIDISEQTLEILAKLPLRELSIGSAGIRFRGSCPGATALECKLLASTFPDLEVLRWASQESNYEDLYAFVNMPNLRHLGLRLVNKPVRTDMLADRPGDTSHPDSPFRILETDLGNDRYLLDGQKRKLSDWHRITRYIARIWPHVQIIPQTRYGPGLRKGDNEERLNDIQYELINGFIASLRNQDSNSGKRSSELWKDVSAQWNAPIFPKRAPIEWEY
ncbi:hypothetical protein FRC06_000398 [Ceratobasidium sp. 370]|nr:hypothetical protein FRC06_000398 [Ceratobasidium sp. 370]